MNTNEPSRGIENYGAMSSRPELAYIVAASIGVVPSSGTLNGTGGGMTGPQIRLATSVDELLG
jgi:hypothetical protein